jgi:hypothetical protein
MNNPETPSSPSEPSEVQNAQNDNPYKWYVDETKDRIIGIRGLEAVVC